MSLGRRLRFTAQVVDRMVARGEIGYMQADAEFDRRAVEVKQIWRKELLEQREKEVEKTVRNES